MDRLTSMSHHVAELMNMPPQHQQPYVGSSAFAHKAGLHTSAIARRPDSYEHVDPVTVGNSTRFLLSDLSGRASIDLKAKELGIDLDPKVMGGVVEDLKRLEHEGYHFEVADASLELLLRRAAGETFEFFDVESFRVLVERGRDQEFDTEATLRVTVDGERIVTVGEGDGPVNALDNAFRNAVGNIYPELQQVHLTDYKVRVIDSALGTGAVTRVLIDSTDGESSWTTIGVSENIIQASWLALSDSLIYALQAHRRRS